MSIIVADASPLIALATINRLELLQKLYQQVLIPEAVKQELKLDSDMSGAKHLKEAVNHNWLQVKSCNYPIEPYQQLIQIIDCGEAEAILLAESLAKPPAYRFLLIDERRGRQVAKNRGITIAGTGAVLLAAKKTGYIDRVGDELDLMQQSGYRISFRLRQRLLELAGEC